MRSISFGKQTTVDQTRLPSPALWTGCPWFDLDEAIPSGQDGIYIDDDFEKMPLIGTQTTQIGYDKYKVFATSGAAVTPVSAVNSVDLGRGILAFTHAADNDSASLAQAYPSFKMSGDATKDGKLWCEARIAVKSLLTLRNGFLFGLAETNLFTLATAVPFNGDAAVPTNGGSFVGFNKWEIVSTTAAATTSLPGGINTSYTDRATSFTQVQADCGIMAAAFTFIKLGFRYDPTDITKCVRFFVDNVEQTSVLTRAQITATTNLKANSLGLIIASVAAASVSTDATYLDWWRCAQVFPG